MPGYTVPTDPADPEQAALEMIVEVPQRILYSTAFRTMLTDYAARLRAERVFAGLTWNDARHLAAAIAYDIIAHEGDAAEHLRNRARNVLAGTSGANWNDPGRAAKALATAAAVLGAVSERSDVSVVRKQARRATQPTRWGS